MPDTESPSPAKPVPGVRKWLLNGLALLIPLLFFALIEGGLRLVGYGADYPLFVPTSSDASYLRQNPDVARRYFKKQVNVPTSQNDYFKALKDTNTYRVFVQGGSSAAGYPLYYGGSFSRMLEQRLLQTFPGRNIEVINTAMAAVNSYTLLDFVDEIIEQDPDLILIYAGHNEYYGSLGVGSAESLGRFRPVISLYLRLQHFRLIQGLQALMMKSVQAISGEEAGSVPGATLMSRLVGEQEIPYGSKLYEQGIAQFESNMEDIFSAYGAHGIPVMIGTIASNEKDHRPFVSKGIPETPDEAWRQAYASALEQMSAGDTSGALVSINHAIEAAPLAANSHFARGRLLESLGQYDEARAAYIKAKDLDQLRFRAPEDINARIRTLAATHDAYVVDTQQALRDRSRHGIIGADVMLEHLHPNVEGYFTIANAFYEAMKEAGLVGKWERTITATQARSEILFTKVDSLVGQYRLSKLMNSWPFQPLGHPPKAVNITPQSEEEELAYALYNNEIGWYEATDRLRAYYESIGNYHKALQAGLALIQEYPFAAPPYLVTGNTLMKQRRFREALNYFEAANEREETAASLRMLGSILLQLQQRERAIDLLERSLALEPRDQQTLYNLSGGYLLTERPDKARHYLDRLLTVNPGHVEGNKLLQRLKALP